MPPKRSTRTRSGAPTARPRQVEVQTETKVNSKQDELENQIKLLQQQIEELRKENDALKNEVSILKQQNNNQLDVAAKKDAVPQNDVKLDDTNQGIIKTKGCTCKGNCSNKICGCVKKNRLCQEFCKCNEASCQNQDFDNKENVEQAELPGDGEKVLQKLNGLSLNQKLLHASQKKAKRSLFSPISGTKGVLNEIVNSPASPITFVTKRRLFSQDSDELTEIRSDSETGNKLDLEKNKNGDHENEDNKVETEEAVNDPNVKQKNHKTRQAKKKVVDSPKVVKTKKNNSKQSDRVDERDEASNIKIKINFFPSNGTKPKPRVEHSPQPIRKSTQHLEVNPIDEKELLKPASARVQHSPPPNLSLQKETPNSSNTQSRSSDTENSTDENSDNSFHPMIPKRQLPRSPIILGGYRTESGSKKFSPAKQELAVAEVDWEQHQAELVICEKCKRKFFPHRIEKHSKSCKGI